MKKRLMILLSLFLLASCGNVKDPNIEYPSTIDGEENLKNDTPSEQLEDENNETPNDSIEEPEEQDTQSNETSSENESNHENDVQQEESTEKSDAKNDHLKELPEYTVISSHIDLSSYTGTIQTDNKGNRIIIFSNDNGQNEYKSIFVKRANRLKVVTFQDDGLIFNDIIK